MRTLEMVSMRLHTLHKHISIACLSQNHKMILNHATVHTNKIIESSDKYPNSKIA